MHIRFDRYAVIRDPKGPLFSICFYFDGIVFTYSHPVSMGDFLRQYGVTQEDLARMSHPCDIWSRTVKRF